MKTNYTSLVALQLAPYMHGKKTETAHGGAKTSVARPRLFGARRPENRPVHPNYYLQTGIAWQPRPAAEPLTSDATAPGSNDLKYCDIFASIVSLAQEFAPPAKPVAPDTLTAADETTGTK